MRNLLLALLHLAVVTTKALWHRWCTSGDGGDLLLKQLIVLRRARKRAPNLTSGDRLLCGFWSIFLGPGRIRKAALALQPSTRLAFHQALVYRKYRRLFKGSALVRRRSVVSLKKAADLFHEVIAKDSAFAPAHAGLAIA